MKSSISATVLNGARLPVSLRLTLLASALLLALPARAQSPAPGVYINANPSGNCVSIGDPQSAYATGGTWQRVGEENIKFADTSTKCDSSRKATQKDSVLFYTVGGTGATSLTLGDELYVNGGFLGLTSKVPLGASDVWGSMRIGDATTLADGRQATAIGVGASAKGDYSVAFGPKAVSTGVSSVAIGRNASASNGNNIAIGFNAQATSSDMRNGGVAIGDSAYAQLTSIAIGYQAKAGAAAAAGSAEVGYAVGIGFQAAATGERAVSIGSGTEGSGAGSLAVGRVAQAIGNSSVALGRSVKAESLEGIAIGNGANVAKDHDGAVSIGANAVSSAVSAVAPVTLNGTTYTPDMSLVSSTVSVGSAAKKRQIVNVGPGAVNATSTDVVVGQQLHAAYTEINKLGAKDVDLDAKARGMQVQIDELKARPAPPPADLGSVAAALGGTVNASGQVSLPPMNLDSIGNQAAQPTTVVGRPRAPSTR